MLAPVNRLTSAREYAEAVRRGRRAGSRTLVVHLSRGTAADSGPPRIGFVVNKAVGRAVTRNQVKRRLRHLARERVVLLPASAVLVVRALPAAASATYAELGADLDRCLSRVLQPVREGSR